MGHYLSQTRINAVDQNVAIIQIILWTIIEIKPGALGQVLHSPRDHKCATKQKYLPSDQDYNGLGRGHYSSRTRINAEEGARCGHYSNYPMGNYLSQT